MLFLVLVLVLPLRRYVVDPVSVAVVRIGAREEGEHESEGVAAANRPRRREHHPSGRGGARGVVVEGVVVEGVVPASPGVEGVGRL